MFDLIVIVGNHFFKFESTFQLFQMIHNHERLLIKLIEQYYGMIPSLTARLLLNHDCILMKRALKYTDQNEIDFKRGLEVLVRCNLASISHVKGHKLLKIHRDKVMNVLYYPNYLVIIKQRFSLESVSLLKTLILYGNLTAEDLIERTLFHIIQVNSLELVDEQLKLFVVALHEKYRELCVNHVIVNAGVLNQFPKPCDTDLVYESLSNKISNTSNQSEFTKKKPKNTNEQCTINFNALNFLLFIELFPYFANQPFVNEEATFVFKLLLEMTFEKSFKMTKTSLSFKEITDRYKKKYPDVNITQLARILRTFSHFFTPDFIIVEKQTCSLDFYTFLNDIVKIIAKEFVKKNFGENSVRMFGALLEEPCVFEQRLLGSLKMETRELHRNLYQLELNRMINMNLYSDANQSSNFSARNIKKAFSVELPEVVTYILNRCQYSLYSMISRLNIELNDQRDLISRKEHIENYKRDITLQVSEMEERTELIKTAHSYMSENDHKKADSLIAYKRKFDKVMNNLINYIFILNMWQKVDEENTIKERTM